MSTIILKHEQKGNAADIKIRNYSDFIQKLIQTFLNIIKGKLGKISPPYFMEI